MKRQWTIEESRAWYDALPWLCGCNFLPSDCVNRLDMWQSVGREEHLATAERELAVCREIGFNTVRLWINFDVYDNEPRKFMETLEKYVALSDKYGQRVMLVLAYEEDLPVGDVYEPKKLGVQKPLYNHFNRDYKNYQADIAEGRVRHYMEYPEVKPRFLAMVEGVVRKYRKDPRVFCLNVWNEPGITIGDRTVPLLEELFARVRAMNPDQPLCADVYAGLSAEGKCRSKSEEVALALSDVISYHNYGPYADFTEQLCHIKAFTNRPVLMTEWLHRCVGNSVELMYPLMMLERIGCYCWGFVAGETYTTEPWDEMWDQLDRGTRPGFDPTKWQHDLFRRNGRPYDPREIEVIRRVNAQSKLLWGK